MTKTNRYKPLVWLLCTAIFLALPPACDSSNNGSGGGTSSTTTGYSQATLAKTWAGTEDDRGTVYTLEVTFDVLGYLTKWVQQGGVARGPFSGKLTVAANGEVTGLLQEKRPPVAGTYTVYYRSFKLRLAADGSLTGYYTEWYSVFSEATGAKIWTSPQWKVKWWMKPRGG